MRSFARGRLFAPSLARGLAQWGVARGLAQGAVAQWAVAQWGVAQRGVARGLAQDGSSVCPAENGQWEIVHGAALQHQGLHEDVTFILVIRRKPLFYIINVLVPSVLLTMLAVSTFYLPPDAGEWTRALLHEGFIARGLCCTRALLHEGFIARGFCCTRGALHGGGLCTRGLRAVVGPREAPCTRILTSASWLLHKSLQNA